nr:MAG TPA: hypothetical protein [Caudoviricetes sp.]
MNHIFFIQNVRVFSLINIHHYMVIAIVSSRVN